MNFNQTINCVLLSPCEDYCFIFGEIDFHQKVKAQSFDPVAELPSNQTVFAACFDSSKRVIFLGGDAGCIEYVDMKTFKYIGKTLKIHKGLIFDIKLIEQEDLLLSCTKSGQIGVWKARSLTLLQLLSSPKLGSFFCILHNNKLNEIYIGGLLQQEKDVIGRVHCFSLNKDPIKIKYEVSLGEQFQYVYYLALSKDEENIFGCGGKGMLFKNHLITQETKFYQGHKFEVWKFLVFEDKNVIVSIGYDQKIILWDLKEGDIRGIIKTNNRCNQTLNFHQRFNQLFVGDEEGFLQKYEYTQFVSLDFLNRERNKKSLNALKGYENIQQKQVETMNLKQRLEQRSLQDLIQMYQQIEKNDIISKVNFGYQIYQKVRFDPQPKPLVDKAIDVMKHIKYIDEFYDYTEMILSDFIQRYQAIKSQSYYQPTQTYLFDNQKEENIIQEKKKINQNQNQNEIQQNKDQNKQNSKEEESLSQEEDSIDSSIINSCYMSPQLKQEKQNVSYSKKSPNFIERKKSKSSDLSLENLSDFFEMSSRKNSEEKTPENIPQETGKKIWLMKKSTRSQQKYNVQ